MLAVVEKYAKTKGIETIHTRFPEWFFEIVVCNALYIVFSVFYVMHHGMEIPMLALKIAMLNTPLSFGFIAIAYKMIKLHQKNLEE